MVLLARHALCGALFNEAEGRVRRITWISADSGGLAPALVSGTIIVAALYFGRELLVPLVIAGLMAFVLAPVISLLERARLPRVLAVLVAVLLSFAVIGAIGAVVWRQGVGLAGNLPEYENTVWQKWHGLTGPGGILHAWMTAPKVAGSKGVAGALDLTHASVLALAGRFAQPILGPLGTAGLVLIFTLFIQLNSEDLRDRFVRLVGRNDLHRTIFALNDAASRLSRYFLFQFIINTSFGVWVGLWLTVLGIPGAVLWGLLAALMRFVPFLGTILALTPPLAITVATAPGWSAPALVLTLFVVSEMIMGQVIEPLAYGRSTGVSPLAILVATSFWALLWGFVGLLIATPLTVCLVVIGRHVESLAFFDVIFGDNPPLEPPEIFYQRALEGRSLALAPVAQAHFSMQSRADYFDRVAISALSMAQRDRLRNLVSYDRLEELHQHWSALLASLAPPEPDGEQQRACGPLLCLPGRGQLDDLVAEMAAQVLREDGFEAAAATNLVLDASAAEEIDFSRVRMGCLSVMPEGATPASVRFFVKRMQKRMPQAVIVVCLWQATTETPLLKSLRAEGKDEHVVLSIGELLAFARAVCTERQDPL